MKQLEQVKQFMLTFGQTIPDKPCIPSKEITDLRVKLSQEELDEYKQAVADNDLVEVADALIDRLYVLLGDFHAHGLGDLLEPLFDEVQASNMSKLDKDGKVLRREDGKILKSDQFFKPDLKSIVENYLVNATNCSQPASNPVDETVQSLRSAMQDKYPQRGLDHNQLRALLDHGHISFKQYLAIVK